MENILILEREEENKKVGMLGSIAVHLILLLICLLPFFSYNQPPQKESGILVSFGVQDAGSEVKRQSEKEITKQEVVEEPYKTTKPVEEVKKEKTKPARSSEAEKVVSKTTQEEAVIIAAQVKAEKQEEMEVQEAEAREDAIKAAEATAAATAAEAKRKEIEYQESKKSFGDLFSSGKGSNNSSGDAGDSTGDPNSDVLDKISSGTGKIGGGISSRDVLYVPKLKDNSQKMGKVVIKVCVDDTGKVSEAEFTQKGSTTTDGDLVRTAINGAKKYKFNKADKDLQCGTITFDFKLK